LDQMITGGLRAQVVSIAAELGIADLLKDGPKPVEALAQATQTDEPSLYRLLRALSSLGVFAEDAAGRFALTPLAEPLRSDVSGSLRAKSRYFCGPVGGETIRDLLHSVRTGQASFEHVIQPGNAPQYGKLVDLLMLGLFASRERTAADWEQLLSAQGFQITQIIPTQAQLSVIETVKC
jgi:hypothetical protein